MTSCSTRRSLVALAWVVACLAGPGAAWADRKIPDEAHRATVASAGTGYIVVDGAVLRLSPAAVIYDDHNRTVTASRVPDGVIAKVVIDAHGDVRRVWILTAEEASQ